MHVLALHGLPTSPHLFSRLVLPASWTFVAPQVPGLGAAGTAKDWSLHGCAAELIQAAAEADMLVGHDLGGVLAAMLARPGQAIVLSGTALGPYWWGIRATSWPVLRRYFYHRHAGHLFLQRGCHPQHAPALVAAFGDHGAGWSTRMQLIARRMSPPKGLAQSLAGCSVHLAWGEDDPWYPMTVARMVRRGCHGTLHSLSAGHFAPWEDPRGFVRVMRHAASSVVT